MTTSRIAHPSPPHRAADRAGAGRGMWIGGGRDAMQILDTLDVVPVWVDAEHLVLSATILMEGHGLGAIAVLDRNGRPTGLLRREVAHRQPVGAKVGEAMEPLSEVLDAGASLREAADLLVRTDRQYAPMVKEDRFRGMITAMHLLDGLRRSWDSMTDLPWSDELRRWGAERLSQGREIAVVFVDLDAFGLFNKRFGHVVGDRVLRRVADFLRERLDAERDILVRYGGDEFAIATLRPHDEAEAFGAELQAASREARLTESGEPILFSIGVYGGNRAIPRDEAHVQATLDDLINLASRRSVAAKPGGAPPAYAVVSLPEPEAFDRSALPDAPEPIPAPQEGSAVASPTRAGLAFEVVEVQVEDDPESLVHVVLRSEAGVSVGVGLRMGRPVPDAVAAATARALERANPGEPLRVEEVVLADGKATVVGIAGEGATGRGVRGAAEGSDPRAVAEATVRAFLVG